MWVPVAAEPAEKLGGGVVRRAKGRDLGGDKPLSSWGLGACPQKNFVKK